VLRLAEQMFIAAISSLPQQVLAVALLVETLVTQVAAKKKCQFLLFFLANEKIFEQNIKGSNIEF
jgi:hypothetical protein